MAIQKINVAELLRLSAEYPVLDVRSPENIRMHIYRAPMVFPLFSDEERKVIRTTYKTTKSGKKPLKMGLDYFGLKMRPMVEEAEKIPEKPSTKNRGPALSVLLHCWRGGMRSAAVAWLLNFYGFHIYLLEGGYKAYRNWVLKQFEKEYNLGIVRRIRARKRQKLCMPLEKKGKISSTSKGWPLTRICIWGYWITTSANQECLKTCWHRPWMKM